MITTSSIVEIQSLISTYRKQNKTIGFVPTMGALHSGHAKLFETSKKNNDITIASIFVNPTQFGPNEDFNKYPRTIEDDVHLTSKVGVDILFLPSVETIYPKNNITYLEPPAQLEHALCGIFRPGHFRGVCTVVNRLLSITTPDRLYLGQKDAQQLRILEDMVERLKIPTKIFEVPTVREKNGLALSSRNKYLSDEEKLKATIIYKSLVAAKKLFDAGEKNTDALIQTTKKILKEEPSFQIQYAELLRWKDFKISKNVEEKSILAIAGFLGKTRLIDNIFLS